MGIVSEAVQNYYCKCDGCGKVHEAEGCDGVLYSKWSDLKDGLMPWLEDSDEWKHVADQWFCEDCWHEPDKMVVPALNKVQSHFFDLRQEILDLIDGGFVEDQASVFGDIQNRLESLSNSIRGALSRVESALSELDD